MKILSLTIRSENDCFLTLECYFMVTSDYNLFLKAKTIHWLINYNYSDHVFYSADAAMYVQAYNVARRFGRSARPIPGSGKNNRKNHVKVGYIMYRTNGRW